MRGDQIANLVNALEVSEDLSEVRKTKWRRLFNAVLTVQTRQSGGRPLLRLVGEVM